ncbi:MAG: hypothetical protein COB23_02440 [Methylophaga sp.]|nr:MAG: hypothetical protein COB23_02440 [Methylophaga sp.]
MNIISKIPHYLFTILWATIFSMSSVQANEINLEKAWETEAIFKLPESVIYDEKRQVLYVSNINEDGFKRLGNGFISKVSLDGEMIEKNWILGMDAPKGLTIVGDKLYATDINSLIEIDIENGEILNRFIAPAAIHLNDVAADDKGQVYAADTLTDSIYRLNSLGLFSLWLNSSALEAPNGLYIEGKKMIVASWGFPTDGFNTEVPGHLKIVSLIDKSIKPLGSGKPVGNLDGVEPDGKGDYYVTDWINGKLLHIRSNGDSKIIMDLSAGAADLEVILEKNLIIIPIMMENKLVAYKIN